MTMWKAALILFFYVVSLSAQQPDGQSITPKKVQTAYYSMQYTEVIQMVKTELETHPTQPPEDLTLYLKYLAMALFAEGGEDAARGALASLLLVNPTFEFSEDEASPKIRALLESMRSEDIQTNQDNSATPTYITIEDQRNSEILSSVMMPGWGHIKRHERRGYIYNTVFFLSIGGALVFTHTTATSHETYLKSFEPDDIRQAYDQYNQNYKIRNNLLILSAATYVVSLLDLVLTAD